MKDLEKALSEKGIKTCPICGMPYTPYHSRQKTCGADKCKREWKNAYLRERTKQLKEKDLEGWRMYRRKANHKYMAKKRSAEKFADELAKLRRYAQHQEEFEKIITEHGHEYGKYSAEKLLATIPKIDVNLDKK